MVKSTDYGDRIVSKETEDNIHSIILRPYITEKTFNLIEKENKLTFIVADSASKKDVNEAIEIAERIPGARMKLTSKKLISSGQFKEKKQLLNLPKMTKRVN